MKYCQFFYCIDPGDMSNFTGPQRSKSNFTLLVGDYLGEVFILTVLATDGNYVGKIIICTVILDFTSKMVFSTTHISSAPISAYHLETSCFNRSLTEEKFFVQFYVARK